jgi:hypothetical protein
MTKAIAIGLKIPDNAAYTALVTLRRLGIALSRVERNHIWLFDDEGDTAALVRRVQSDETVFNPNTHHLRVLESNAPRPGELWIEPLTPAAQGPASVAWRLFDERGPARHAVLTAAADRLLCNPAIERARTA